MSRAKVVHVRHEAEFVVETMTEHDLLEVVEIEEQGELSLWGWEAYRAELERTECIMLVARPRVDARINEQSVSGFIAARIGANELHVNNVGVRESFRRRGAGAALLGAALDIAKRHAVESAVLEVRAGNYPAQSLYRSLGFVVAGRRVNYYRNPTEDALVMSLAFHTGA